MLDKGKVFLVGAGPGDPNLITLKGLECLQNADVVFYDSLIDKNLLSHAGKKAELIYCGKKLNNHSFPQDEINRLMIKKAKKGKIVVRLKGGDPFIFGRGGEEALALVKEGIAFEIVPGVSSAIAVPAYAGIPMTHRNYASAVTFITGHRKDRSSLPLITQETANLPGTLVILMGASKINVILNELIKHGKDPSTPVAVISSGTTEKQKTLTGTIREVKSKVKNRKITSPSIIVVGDVVNLREKLEWFEKKPLLKKRIIVTSPEPGASKIASHLEELGAETIKLPVIKITPVKNFRRIDKAIKEIENYDWIIFTSQNGIDLFLKRFILKRKNIKDFKKIKFATIGKVTSEKLKEYGINASFVPKKYTSEALVAGLRKHSLKGKNILIPRALEASNVLPEWLRKMGAKTDEIVVYRIQNKRVKIKKVKSLLKESKIDAIAFTSPSGVKSFFNLFAKKDLKSYFKNTKIASIGPVTSKAIEKFGIKADIVPKKYTVKALVEAIESNFKNQISK